MGRFQTRGFGTLRYGLLLSTYFWLGVGCDRQQDLEPSAPAVQQTVDPGDAIETVEGVSTKKKGDQITVVDLTKVSADELPKAVAATVLMPNVEEVRFKGSHVGDPSVLPIAGITSLRRLRVTDTSITDTTLEKLGDVGRLQLLHLHNAPSITLQGLQQLAKLGEMKELSLSGSNIGDSVVPFLGSLKKLKKLRMRGTAITGEGFSPLGDSNIVDLELAETAFGNSGMPAIASMPALTKLNLWLTKIDDEGLESLRGKTSLTSLNLDNIPEITDQAIDVILTLPDLTFLHLGKTNVSADGVSRLAELQKLETLHVTNLGIPEPVIQKLRSQLPSLQNLVN